MSVLDFIVLVLAASAWVDCWFNGSIFDEWRAYFQARGDAWPSPYPHSESSASSEPIPQEPQPWWMTVFNWLPDWFCELVSCKFCFSHHTPWVLATVSFLPALFVAEPWDWLLKLPVYSLAATRLGNIINAYLPDRARYDRGTEGVPTLPPAGSSEQ